MTDPWLVWLETQLPPGELRRGLSMPFDEAVLLGPGIATRLAAWTDWLAAIGYGIDFSSDTDPPCTLRELAKAMHRADPSESVETWEWCVTENTGAFTARAEAVGDASDVADRLDAALGGGE